MTKRRAELVVEMKVEFIPLPKELEPAWRASLLLLLNLLKTGNCDGRGTDHSMQCMHETGNDIYPWDIGDRCTGKISNQVPQVGLV